MRYELIDTQEKFLQVQPQISNSKYLGIDTESDSLYSYYEKLCLVQIACEHKIYLLDSLVLDLSCFKEIFENPDIRKIFHSADSDIPLIKTKISCEFSNIFDVMMAAKYLGIERCGLNNLIEKYFAVKLNKKYQKADWGYRPIKEEMLEYAAMDVYYLKKLKDIFIPELKKTGLFEEFMVHCEQFSALPPKRSEFNPQAWLNLSGARNMPWPYSACLKELWTEREKTAQKKDIPPFKIMTNETLISLAREPQKALKNLKLFKGISEYVMTKHEDWIKKAIMKGLNSFPEEKHTTRRKEKSDFEKTKKIFDFLREWRKNKAKERKLFPELILTNEILWKIAYKNKPSRQELAQIIKNGHKADLYAEELAEKLALFGD